MLIDPFGRPIVYLRISLTDRCNLRCVYCMPDGTTSWMPRKDILTDDEIVRVARTAADLGLTSIRLTGGEPLVRPGVVSLVGRLAAINGIKDISLTTNAIQLARLAQPLAQAGLRRVNISLDTLNRDKFKQITRLGNFDQAWQGILAAEQAGLTPLKLNTVVVGDFNSDELPSLALLTIEHAWHIRFIELMPVGDSETVPADILLTSPNRYYPVQQMHEQLKDLDLQPSAVPTGNGPARIFRIPGALGTVGFISPLGEHFCENCNRLRLTADGRLRSCLLKAGEVDLKPALQSGGELESLFQAAIQLKPIGHMLSGQNNPSSPNSAMSLIGG
jgi:cyclic pyranopterin phosphate synthase